MRLRLVLVIAVCCFVGNTAVRADDDEVIVLPPFVVTAPPPPPSYIPPQTNPPPPITVPPYIPSYGGGGTGSGSGAGSGQASWQAAAKTPLSGATGLSAKAIATLRSNPKLLAAVQAMIAQTKASYYTDANYQPTARESGFVFYVDSNGNLIGDPIALTQSNTYHPGEGANIGYSGVAPPGAMEMVEMHTHAWGTDISGNATTSGDYQVAQQNSAVMVGLIPMGTSNLEFVTPGAAQSLVGSTTDVGVPNAGYFVPPHVPGTP